jgi:murein DD-endopeptidase MepM/ murein hydrolase activator NlpD
MDKKITWFAAMLLPVLASCSSQLGIVKKSQDLSQSSKETLESTKADRTAAAPGSQQEGAFHIVGSGESLKHICEVYGLDFQKVAKINRILPPYSLKPGDTIFLPAYALLPESKTCSSDSRGSSEKTAIIKATRQTVANAIKGKRDPRVPELKFPVPGGVLTSPFGVRWGRIHKGLDIAAPVGKPVLACADGRVIFTGSRKKFRRYGNTVLIDHGRGVYTYYAHLSGISVKKNQQVRKGQKIALVGNTGRSTGPHLHLEVRVTNTMYNPLAYFSPNEIAGTLMAKRFSEAPMGPVRAGWEIPDLLTASR